MTHSSRSQLYASLSAREAGQPATNFWRAIEIDCFQRGFDPRGETLDLGCGTGEVSRVLLAKWNRITRLVGVDLDPIQLAIARDSGVYAEARVGNAHALPFADAAFDSVFSNSVVEHIPGPEIVFAEVARVLRSGGRFAVTVPSDSFHDCLRGPRFPASLYLPNARERYLLDIDARLAHVTYFGESFWRPALERLGFEELSFEPYFTEHQVQTWELLSNLTGGVVWGLTRGRVRPIEGQRRLGLDGTLGMASRLVNRLGGAFSGNALSDEPGARRHGCVLIGGTKR